MKLLRHPFLIILSAFMAIIFVSSAPKAADGIDKEAIQKIIREYLVQNPEVIMEALESYQENQKDIEASKFKETLADSKEAIFSDDLPYAGNPDGDVIIVEFFDYNCGYCKRAMKDLNKVLEKDKNVKVIFREMPILSESSRDAARYSLAAHKQGKYFEYHQALMNHSGSKNKKSLEKLAEDIGLDAKKLSKDAESKEIRGEIEKSMELSRKLGIRGTPAFLINDIFAPGYITYPAMQDIIKRARSNDEG